MIYLDVEQGTPDWDTMKIGLPSASGFDKIITPAKLKRSSQADEYRNQLLAEWIMGVKLQFGNHTAFIERGRGMEQEARDFYELQFDVDVIPGGIVLRDDQKVGGSPDGLIGDDGGVEFKCPALHTHVGYLVDPQALVSEYHGQVQGYLYLTGRDWWDILSYNPGLPPVIERVLPDPRYQAALEPALSAFLEDFDRCKELLEQHRAVGHLEVTISRVMGRAKRMTRPAREWAPRPETPKTPALAGDLF